MMLKRLALGLLVAGVATASLLGVVLAGPQEKEASVNANAGLALKVVGYVGGVAGLPAFVGIASAGSLLIDIIDSGKPIDDIEIIFDKPPGRLELGLSMSVDIEVRFKHVDGWLADEKYFVELVTIADGQIIKRMLYPKTGIKEDGAFSSDSESLSFKDKVWLGAQEYKCAAGITKFEFKAVVWSAQLGDASFQREYTDAGDLSGFARGTTWGGRDWEKKTWDEYMAWRGSWRVIAKDEKSFEVILPKSPFYVQVKESDDGTTEEHGTAGKFAHTYIVGMNYRQALPTSGGVVVLDPQPQRATINVDRLNAVPDWAPWAEDTVLTWVVGQGQKADPTFTDQGSHIPDPRPHTATYTNTWGATVTGRNTIEVQGTEDPSTIRSIPYTWTGPFWLEGVEGEVCDFRYTVNDFRPAGDGGGGDGGGGGGGTPTPTPTPFEPTLPFQPVPPPSGHGEPLPPGTGDLIPPGATTTPTPTPTPFEETPPTVPAPPSATPSFVHTQPGVESEIRLLIYTRPGDLLWVTASGPGLITTATQSGTADEFGELTLIWRINQFGVYLMDGNSDSGAFLASVNVQ